LGLLSVNTAKKIVAIPDSKSFQIDIKGLVFNDAGKLMLLQEPQGTWDLPGGRMEHGETFEQTLKRECQEEMGVNCNVLDTIPYYAWPVKWTTKNIYLVYLAFRITVDSYDFKQTNECCGYDFFTPGEMDTVNIIDALYPLQKWLNEK
jgi:8-oxo-dGTP diphosphatase